MGLSSTAAMYIAAGAGTASAGADFIGQKRQLEAYEDYQEDTIAATVENYQAIDKAEQNAAYNAGQDTLQAQIDAMQASAQVETQAASKGVAGGSVQATLDNITQQKNQAQSDINMQLEQEQYGFEQQAKQAQRSGTTQSSSLYKPSVLGSAAKGAGTAASVYTLGTI